MLKRKKIIILVMTTIFLISSFTACTNNDTIKTQSKDTIVYGITSSPTGLFNPLLSHNPYDNQVIDIVYNSLLYFEQNLTTKPQLAHSYEVSNDKLTITYKLRDDVKWNDGQKFTAEDVAFTFKCIVDKNYNGVKFIDVNKIKGVTEYHEGYC